MNNICPVCGYPELVDPAYDQDGGGSLEICPSCGYQFGYTDDDRHITHAQWRGKWIEKGMKWDKGRSTPPLNWNPKKQLENISVSL